MDFAVSKLSLATPEVAVKQIMLYYTSFVAGVGLFTDFFVQL